MTSSSEPSRISPSVISPRPPQLAMSIFHVVLRKYTPVGKEIVVPHILHINVPELVAKSSPSIAPEDILEELEMMGRGWRPILFVMIQLP